MATFKELVKNMYPKPSTLETPKVFQGTASGLRNANSTSASDIAARIPKILSQSLYRTDKLNTEP